MELNLKLNGEPKRFFIKPNDKLIDVLRKEGYYGTKKGCGEGECGACLVLVDGKSMNSCLIYAGLMEGRSITTIEGISKPGSLSPVQEELLKAGAVQCGYCIPGMVIAATELLAENTAPTDADIRKALDGNICRCTGYVKQLEGVRNAAKRLARKPRPAKETPR